MFLVLFLLAVLSGARGGDATCSSNWDCLTDSNCDGSCSDGKCVYRSVLNCKDSLTTPYCDKWNGRCVQCRIDSDCPFSSPFCQSGQCVACLQDSHCRSEAACNSVCQGFKCAPLATIVQCNPDEKCYKGLGRCFPTCGTRTCSEISKSLGETLGDRCSDGICYDCLNLTDCEGGDRCGSKCLWNSITQRTFCSEDRCLPYQDCIKRNSIWSECVVNLTRYNATLGSFSSFLDPNFLLVLISMIVWMIVFSCLLSDPDY